MSMSGTIRSLSLGVGALACLVGATQPASAEESACRACSPECLRTLALLPEPHASDFPLLYSPRHDELTLEVGYVSSSLPMRSAVETTAMYSLALDDQRIAFGARAGVTAGRWGADDRGPVALGLGARFAIDLVRPMGDVLAVYAFLQGDFLLFADQGNDALRAALGLGVRIARAVALEASASPIVSLGGPFAGEDRVAGGFAVGLSLDFCAIGGWCNETPKAVSQVDRTQELYAEAAALAPADAPARGLLCSAVSTALDAGRYPARDGVDATEAFLNGVMENTSDAATRAKLALLVGHHHAWRKQLVDSREAQRCAAAEGRTLAEHDVYSPFPVEIRTYFGCD
jgi:hypothetical protein